jgi:hypothetical protein
MANIPGDDFQTLIQIRRSKPGGKESVLAIHSCKGFHVSATVTSEVVRDDGRVSIIVCSCAWSFNESGAKNARLYRRRRFRPNRNSLNGTVTLCGSTCGDQPGSPAKSRGLDDRSAQTGSQTGNSPRT